MGLTEVTLILPKAAATDTGPGASIFTSQGLVVPVQGVETEPEPVTVQPLNLLWPPVVAASSAMTSPSGYSEAQAPPLHLIWPLPVPVVEVLSPTSPATAGS